MHTTTFTTMELDQLCRLNETPAHGRLTEQTDLSVLPRRTHLEQQVEVLLPQTQSLLLLLARMRREVHRHAERRLRRNAQLRHLLLLRDWSRFVVAAQRRRVLFLLDLRCDATPKRRHAVRVRCAVVRRCRKNDLFLIPHAKRHFVPNTGLGLHNHVVLAVVRDEQLLLHHLPGKTPAKIEENVVTRDGFSRRKGEEDVVLLESDRRQLRVNRNRGQNGNDVKRGDIEQVCFVLEVKQDFVISGLKRLQTQDDKRRLKWGKEKRLRH